MTSSGNSVTYNSTVETDYGGWKSQTSVPHAESDTPFWTKFADYDPFGRPGKTTSPDNKDTTFSRTGARKVSRTVSVATSSGSQDATTTETYDNLGRLRTIDEPSGESGAQVSATYAYDQLDHLISATTTSGTTTQSRSFTYDLRGTSRSSSSQGSYSRGIDRWDWSGIRIDGAPVCHLAAAAVCCDSQVGRPVFLAHQGHLFARRRVHRVDVPAREDVDRQAAALGLGDVRGRGAFVAQE